MMTATNAKRSSRISAEVAAAVRPLAKALADAHDFVLWDVAFLRDAGRELLRVACDRVGGVTADDLATFADQLSREIDRSDVVPGEQRYMLEVTSPGAERTLNGHEQFRVCTGRVAKISLNDGRTLEGPIGNVSDRAVEITSEDGSAVRVLFDDIANARLVVKL